MKKATLFCILFLSISSVVYSGQESRIELKDGSVINAEIISLYNGVYTFRGASLGAFSIDASKIRKIESIKPSAPAEEAQESRDFSDVDVKSQIADLKMRIAADQDVNKMIVDLSDDPQMQEILKDPDIVEAVNSGDIKKLMSNDKFMGLVNNPKIRDIGDKLKK